jgi:hypothetical protein
MRFNPVSLNPRLLLYLSAAGASCALYRRGSLGEVHSLPMGEEGWEHFNSLLLKHPGLPVAIAVDTVDELYRHDILPSVHGPDRREMTERRLRQMIHHSPYRAALRQGAAKDNDHRDRYLMMGLSNPEIIRPWLDIIHVRGSHLSGIWLLPALAIPLARQFRLSNSRLLLVSEQTGGLRLTYLENGELRFSRLAPVDGSQYENPLESYAEEIERTRQALVGQRLLARAEPLRTVLLDPLNTLSELHAFLPASSGFQCETIQRAQLLDTLDLPPSLLAESADALYLRLLISAPANANLMTREQHEEARIRWWSRGLRFVAVAWVGLSLLTCIGLLLDAWRLDHQARDLGDTTRAHSEKEAKLLAEAGGAGAVHQRLGAIHAWRAVEAQDKSPIALLKAAFEASTDTGQTLLNRLEWTADNPGSGATLAVEGEISPFDGNFDGAHQRVELLLNGMRSRMPPEMRAKVALWPLNSASDQGLEGEFGHSRLNARFRIETSLKP